MLMLIVYDESLLVDVVDIFDVVVEEIVDGNVIG